MVITLLKYKVFKQYRFDINSILIRYLCDIIKTNRIDIVKLILTILIKYNFDIILFDINSILY